MVVKEFRNFRKGGLVKGLKNLCYVLDVFKAMYGFSQFHWSQFAVDVWPLNIMQACLSIHN